MTFEKKKTVEFILDDLVDMKEWCIEKKVSFELMKKICISQEKHYYKISGVYYQNPLDLLYCYNICLKTSKVNLQEKIRNKIKVEANKKKTISLINQFFYPEKYEELDEIEESLKKIFKKGILNKESNLDRLKAIADEYDSKNDSETNSTDK